MNTLRHLVAATLIAAVAWLAAPSPAAASPAVGLRGGFTDDPDSIFFGGHLVFPFARNFRFDPSLELGFGEYGRDVDFFSLRINGDFKYMIPVGSVALFPLFGPSLYYWNDDLDNDDTEFGINLGFGVEFQRFMFSLTVGIEDLPDLAFTFGYTF